MHEEWNKILAPPTACAVYGSSGRGAEASKKQERRRDQEGRREASKGKKRRAGEDGERLRTHTITRTGSEPRPPRIGFILHRGCDQAINLDIGTKAHRTKRNLHVARAILHNIPLVTSHYARTLHTLRV